MPAEGRDLSSRQTQNVAQDMEIGKPINSGKCSETAEGVARERRREVLSESRMRGAIGSWNELASASLVRSKPSRQDGSEFCGRRGDAGSEA